MEWRGANEVKNVDDSCDTVLSGGEQNLKMIKVHATYAIM